LIYQKKINLDEIQLNLLSEEMLNTRLTLVAQRMLEHGAIKQLDEIRNLKEDMTTNIIEDYVEISNRTEKLPQKNTNLTRRVFLNL